MKKVASPCLEKWLFVLILKTYHRELKITTFSYINHFTENQKQNQELKLYQMGHKPSTLTRILSFWRRARVRIASRRAGTCRACRHLLDSRAQR
jgi:hypothetical protein